MLLRLTSNREVATLLVLGGAYEGTSARRPGPLFPLYALAELSLVAGRAVPTSPEAIVDAFPIAVGQTPIAANVLLTRSRLVETEPEAAPGRTTWVDDFEREVRALGALTTMDDAIQFALGSEHAGVFGCACLLAADGRPSEARQLFSRPEAGDPAQLRRIARNLGVLP